jgi:methionyl-tRNA formyltransferase
MRLVFMGSPEFALAPLRYLVQEGWEVAAVYTKPDKPAGRGQGLSLSPVKHEALRLGLPVVQPRPLKNPEAVAQLASFHPEVIVVAAYGLLLPPAVLSLPRFGCVNLHPSLLPRHRGASPVTATILSGDAWGGASIMLLDEGLDTGPVFTQAAVRVREDDTSASLGARLSLISAQLLQDVLSDWVRERLRPRPQDSARATYFKMVNKEDGEIDWQKPALETARRVRAFQPWPGAFTRYQGKLIKLLAARVTPGAAGNTPGRVVALPGGFGVETGEGVLEVMRLQLEGRQPVLAGDFVRGQRQFIGVLLPSSVSGAGTP